MSAPTCCSILPLGGAVVGGGRKLHGDIRDSGVANVEDLRLGRRVARQLVDERHVQRLALQLDGLELPPAVRVRADVEQLGDRQLRDRDAGARRLSTGTGTRRAVSVSGPVRSEVPCRRPGPPRAGRRSSPRRWAWSACPGRPDRWFARASSARLRDLRNRRRRATGWRRRAGRTAAFSWANLRSTIRASA